MTQLVFSDTRCALGEGPLWHPERRALIWFDILGKTMYLRGAQGPQIAWGFDEHVSAAGWVERDTLILASETGLYRFSLADGTRSLLTALEADQTATRSNDGRADPWGGFWIGTMGKAAEPGMGAIYRYYQGALRSLFSDITISNAICFAPDRSRAYFADTVTQTIQQVRLDDEGWPKGAPQVFVDLSDEDLNPDGAVTDSEGNLWNAQWGASRVACYDRDGRFVTAVGVPAGQVTCPSFGGPDFRTLYITSAADGAGAQDGWAGATFSVGTVVPGLAEPRVLLG